MKKIQFLIALACISMSASTVSAIEVKTPNAVSTTDGNYKSAPRKTREVFTDTVTGKTFTDSKGVEYKVFKNKSDIKYYWKTSARSGNKYKVRIKE